MWWSDPEAPARTLRRGLQAAVLMMALSAAACGFSPVYGPSGSGEALAGAVTVSAPEEEIEFDLARALEDRFGPPVAARYTLQTDLTTRSQRVSITATQDTNRFNLVGQVEWTLIEDASGDILAEGRSDGFSSYAATGTTVATSAAERDAYRRLMIILADRIAIDLNSRTFGASNTGDSASAETQT